MKGLRNLLDFYLNSSIHVGLAVVALTWVTSLHFAVSTDLDLLGFVFFGTVTGYNFVKYAGIAKLHHRSLAKNLRVLQVFSFLSFLALGYFTARVGMEVLYVAGVLGLLTAMYALPVFNKKNLRSIKGLKVYVIATIWTGVSVLFPAVELDLPWNKDLAIEFFQRFVLVLVLLIPFEIRDLKYDAAELRTIPQKYGVKRTKLLGVGLLLLILFAGIFKGTTTAQSFGADVAAFVLTGILVLKSREDQSRYYTTLLVEAIPLVWLAVLWCLI